MKVLTKKVIEEIKEPAKEKDKTTNEPSVRIAGQYFSNRLGRENIVQYCDVGGKR